MNIGEIKKEEELSVEQIFAKKEVPSWKKQLTIRAFVVTCELRVVWGFGSYLFAMSEQVVKQSAKGQDGFEYKNPELGWIIGFLFVVSFLGLFSLVPLRKIKIIDFKLTYPSGTATAHLFNSFHTPEGAKLAKKQVRELGKFFTFSFFWSFFQWFFTATDACATYVGVGMICPHIVNVSVLIGGILSWDLDPDSMQGLKGYKVFIAIALILGDGLYNFTKVLSQTIAGLYNKIQDRNAMHLPVAECSSPVAKTLSYDDQRWTQLFVKDQIPTWLAIGGYVAIAAVSTATLPHIFHQLKWYHIIVIYIFAPVLAICNAFGCGLTDWSLASAYGKLAIFTIGAWAGASYGGVLAGLAACGVMMNIVSTASDLMQDFKTGYMTLASPRSMFVSQVIGTAMGCVISPCVFWIFYKAFPDLGMESREYPAPFASVYYSMAKLGVEGFSALPKECLKLCYAFFAAAILINIIRDALGKKRSWFIPLPMAMAIPFFLGSYFAIDMCIGSLILFIWQKKNKAGANAFAPAVASGLICGDGLWALPSSILALAGLKPPICMKFLSRATNNKVDTYLGS
ncbi:putative metal-nicotianamine transporter YSL7 [Forsythia ovata]|uniref:Metal-nicotianamine transporter YSL7 n=1 Tax=Forsythia ovata TaxID=205694 RepID=A0ABD1WUW0_9LAMI